MILKAVSMSTMTICGLRNTNFQTGVLGTRYTPVWYGCKLLHVDMYFGKYVSSEEAGYVMK